MEQIERMVENFKELEPKQKITLIVTIVLFVFVVTYGYKTFFPSSSISSVPQVTSAPPPPQPAPTTSSTASSSGTSTSTSQTTMGTTQTSTTGTTSTETNQQQQMGSVTQQPTRQLTQQQQALLQQSQQVQKEYLDLVSKYQIAQLQQKLATAEAGIATAKLQSAQTQQQAQQLSGQLQQQMQSTTVQTPVAHSDAGLQVVYVAKRQGHWMAMLNDNGSYFEVKVGTRLPDGSVISRIDGKGVILTNNGQRSYVAIPKTLD